MKKTVEQTMPRAEHTRTRSLGQLQWYRATEGSAEVAPVESHEPFADVTAAEAWLKKALGDGAQAPGVFELHRVVKRVEPKAVVVAPRFEW